LLSWPLAKLMPTMATRVRISRAAVGAVVGFACSALLLGCPLYDDDCEGNCARGYECEPYTGACTPIVAASACTTPGQCAAAETCTPEFVCRPGSCTNYGCVSGFQCGVVGGAHACVPQADAAAAPTDAGVEPVDASSASAAASDAAVDAATDAAAESGPDTGP
jgi:hypothetical protein